MADTDDFTTHASRLASFERPHHFAKRRASSTKKKAQPAVAWPHADPSAEDLARAGFYYKPSPGNPDSVTCFLCDKALDGWEAGDNPATEHLNHVPHCGWAINVCIELRSQDMDRAEEDPMSEKMAESRRATFKDVWPHEGRKGWKCKIQKMVDAGWCYAPLPEADDCVHCFYCGVSLDGWEPKDDPWDEHRRRAPDCHFFTLLEELAKLKKQTKRGKGRTSRASRASRASRLSTQSNLTMTSEAPLADDLEDDPVDEGDTVMTTMSTASKAAKGGRKARKPAAPKKGRATRTRQGSVAAESTIVMEPAAEPEVEIEPSMASPAADEPLKPQPKARGKRQPKRVVNSQMDGDASVLEEQQPVRKVSRAQTRKQQKVVDDSQLDTEEQAAELAPPVPAKSPKRATRGKKRTSDGLEKLDSSVMVIEPPQSQPSASESQTQGRKRGRPSKGSVASQDESKADRTFDNQSQQQPQPKKRGRPSKESLEKRAAEATVALAEPTVVPDELDDAADEPAPAPAKVKGKTKKRVAPSKQKAPETAIDKPSSTGVEEDQEESIVLDLGQPPSTTSPPPALQSDKRSPTASPQSSDAENHPPSSRPSFGASQQRHAMPPITRIPLAASTPRTSPSKRNIVSQLSTSIPWTAVDLETVFLPSPSRREDKENQTANIENVLQRLSSPEKKMSVEDWILWNAKGAEEKLRGECERMIGAFETEGNRALQSLEGIQAL